MLSLPIDSVLPELVTALREREAVVLEAPPGAGKTTRVPPALLDAGLAQGKEIVVLQPRRLATRLAAARVAFERGEPVGKTIGYNVRFDDVSSTATKIRFVTEGVLTRRLMGAPTLPDVGVVVLDEFHERHLAGDLALAMLRRLQQTTRADLKLLVMSATLDAAPIAAWLGNAPVLRSQGRPFEVAVEYLEREEQRPLEEQVLGALKRLVQSALDGHVLVFLPGASEIRRCREALGEFSQRHELEIHLLHGDLSAQEQDLALRPSAKRKVILATNVAETSVTIDGIAAVIDSGLHRAAAHSPWSGLGTLRLSKTSKASAQQRAGRAGRTRAGRCLRLYTRGDFDGRAAADTPEIRRLDFTESALALRALGVEQLASFPFFEAPAPAALEAADGLLRRLGAIGPEGALTHVGKRMLRFPVHPRLARLIDESERLGVPREGATVAALLGEKDIRIDARARLQERTGGADVHSAPSDVLELLERFARSAASGARGSGLDAGAVQAVERVRRQLVRLVDVRRSMRPEGAAARDSAVLRAVLAAYSDRVAKRRRPRSAEVVFSQGGSGVIDSASVVQQEELMVAVDAEERKGGVVVRLASAVEPEWLLDAAPADLGEADALVWNTEAKRVERVIRLTYGNITLEESRQSAPPSEGAFALLKEHALAVGPTAFVSAEDLGHWVCRVEALRAAFPQAGFPSPDAAFLAETLGALCEGLRSFKELEEAQFVSALTARLSGDQVQLLRTQAPERITLPGGRSVAVHYEAGKPPWIESRLQDFFGLSKGPSIGRTPLVLHLLAPNQRAVQVTTDLAGFWERHYPALRRELSRRYPRHPWPENPLSAAPPAPRNR